MQNKRLFTTEMDFSAVDKPPIFLGTVKQLDGVTLKITPLAEYNPMTMIGVTPKLYAKKPNGEFVYQDVDIDVDLSTSQITIQCKNFMFSDVGTVEMEIELYDDDNYLRTSPTFEIDVTQKLNQLEMEDLKEGVHISLLEELMDYIAESKDYVERFKELLSEFGDDDTVMLENLIVVRMMLETLSSEVDRLENTITQAQEYEFEMANQEIARVAAEEKRVEAEVLRVQAETNRVNEEAKRRTTEQGRVSAENTRVSNENTREANEVVRRNNETQRIEAETQRQNRYNSFISDAEANANDFENYTNTAKVKEEERKANELDRKTQENRRISNEVERISNENTRKANEETRESNEASRQDIFENKVNEVDEKISEINTTKDNFISSINTKVDNKISEIDKSKTDMTNTVSNKINEVENRFNALTSKQQQDAEVIDARDGETSLKARLDRDIEKAKQVYVGVEGSHISTDSYSGYAKNVEILGNTIQDASNLADIRSVGDTVEGQELYEITVLSVGKNLLDYDNPLHTNARYDNNGNLVADNIANTYKVNVMDGVTYRTQVGLGGSYYTIWKGDKFVGYKVLQGNTTHQFTCDGTYDNVRYSIFHDREQINSVKMFYIYEGKSAEYEPYQEDKLTILSPVQLEKVGDVADRIIEKDGVWGVEKNVKLININDLSVNNAIALNQWKERGYRVNFRYANDIICNASKVSCMFNRILSVANSQLHNHTTFPTVNSGGLTSDGFIRIHLDIPLEYGEANQENAIRYLKDLNLTMLVGTTQPQFIPLPHDQQVKLRTFANKTNISFLTEIEGTIKAQVPKSLGATVNTHTEQISNLNKELDRVKKLEESTVSTVETESDFTTVEATSNGYFEDVKLEGKTLVNHLCNSENTVSSSKATNKNYVGLQVGKTYTAIAYVIENNNNKPFYPFRVTYSDNVQVTIPQSAYPKGSVITHKFELADKQIKAIWVNWCSTYESGDIITTKTLLLEGDHTQNPPSYFEGLKSVGDTTDEIVVSSVNENLFDRDTCKYNTFTLGSGEESPNSNYVLSDFIKVNGNTSYYIEGLPVVVAYDSNKNPIKYIRNTNIPGTFTTDFNCSYVRIRNWDLLGSIELQKEAVNSAYLIKGTTPKPYTPRISDKKRLLYYNEETQAWEKPILRQWDSIEKHADGKYYYHQRSGEVVLNGSEDWFIETLSNTDFVRFKTLNSAIKHNKPRLMCDKFIYQDSGNNECIFNKNYNFYNLEVTISTTKLPTQDVQGFKQWLQANNITAVHQLAEEKVYECTNIDLITYANETNYIVESGAIVPRSTLKVHNNISNVVSLLQKKVSLLESNVKASQEVQDMMILETDMRMLDIELALMDFMPMTLNLGGSNMLRSATYFNFLKNHIINETYEKEYLENVMNKYLATGRINQDEYDELYKMLYPPVYDIELPIEY